MKAVVNKPKPKLLAPPPIPDDSKTKTPDAGKGVAVLSKGVKKAVLQMDAPKKASESRRMDWMPAKQYNQMQKGLKKAKSARSKNDKTETAARAKLVAAIKQPSTDAAFKPKVAFGGPGSGPQPGAVKPSLLSRAVGKIKDAIGSKPKEDANFHIGPRVPSASSHMKIGALKIGHSERSMSGIRKVKGVKRAKTPMKTSKPHPINPMHIKPPKGSAQAPGKSIGVIKAMKDRRLYAVVRHAGVKFSK